MKFFKNLFKHHKPKETMGWTGLRLYKALHHNGAILERARLERRSLNYDERNIVVAIRSIARMERMSENMINMSEMEGERDRALVYEPIKVKVKFAYYTSAYHGHSVAEPSFIVVKSNHPVLILHGNFGLEELKRYDVDIPRYPSFEKWDKAGRPCFRG